MLFKPLAIAAALCLAKPGAYAYIPAVPTNSTQDAIAGGLNVTDISQLYMQWYSNGCAIVYHLLFLPLLRFPPDLTLCTSRIS